MEKVCEKYFMGSMSADGFRSDFKSEIDSDGVFTYILKGGAGTGKSTLMKKVAAAFEDRCEVVRYYCSSDPDSIDAVFVKQAGVIVVDGTAPHTFDPQYPAVKQTIVNLGDSWDSKKLKENTASIISATDSHRRLMNRAKSYVGAMSRLYDDTIYMAGDELDVKKLEAAVARLCVKIMPKKNKEGSVRMSLVGAVTPKGYMLQKDTLSGFDRIYVIDDDLFAVSDMLQKLVCENAVKRGYNVTVSRCGLFTQSVYELVMIKELGVAFVASTPINLFAQSSDKVVKINGMRFYDVAGIRLKKRRLKANRNACSKLLEECVTTLSQAKAMHDEIEKYYISAMDFSLVDKSTRKIISEIRKRLVDGV
ncbi:MAG: ATPase [Oscillospiraceae bacterium]|nr:ATPase [Oscillospiraceae bacterium]